jgi:hypothetical protein
VLNPARRRVSSLLMGPHRRDLVVFLELLRHRVRLGGLGHVDRVLLPALELLLVRRRLLVPPGKFLPVREGKRERGSLHVARRTTEGGGEGEETYSQTGMRPPGGTTHSSEYS